MGFTELPWTFYGRKVRPYAFGVMYATFIISWNLLVTKNGPGEKLDRSVAGYIVGVIGMSAFIALLAGFWAKRDGLMMIGLLLTSGAWMARGVYITLEQGVVESGMLSFGWVVASVGAFFLEFFTGEHSFLRRRSE